MASIHNLETALRDFNAINRVIAQDALAGVLPTPGARLLHKIRREALDDAAAENADRVVALEPVRSVAV